MWLKYGVAPGGELASIDGAQRGKTQLTCLYCGGGLTAKKGNVKEHHFAHTLETCKFVSQRIKTKAFPTLPLYDNFHVQLKGKRLLTIYLDLPRTQVSKICVNHWIVLMSIGKSHSRLKP